MAETYTDQYIEQTFYLWHRGGRKISPRFANSLPEDENGQRPTFKTIEQWRDRFAWIDRADALDAEISNTLQQKVIDDRVHMYEEHTELADSLIEKAKDFLANNPIKEMKDALKAIELGIEIQRVSVGQADFGRKLLEMSDEQLTKEINKMLQPKVANDEFIDLEVMEDGKGE